MEMQGNSRDQYSRKSPQPADIDESQHDAHKSSKKTYVGQQSEVSEPTVVRQVKHCLAMP